jgi:hypothetical protein
MPQAGTSLKLTHCSLLRIKIQPVYYCCNGLPTENDSAGRCYWFVDASGGVGRGRRNQQYIGRIAKVFRHAVVFSRSPWGHLAEGKQNGLLFLMGRV